MKKVAFLCLDFPDYFSGFHYPVVQVPVFGNMTFLEVAEQMETEINSIYDYLFDEHPKHEKLYQKYIRELKKKPEKIFVEYEAEAVNEDDFFEGPYLYFSVIDEKYNNNIKFLG